MVRYQGKSGRIISGGRFKQSSEKKKSHLGRPATETQIAEERKRLLRVRGGNQIQRLFRTQHVNVTDPDAGKTQRAEIKDVTTNPASREYSRRRVITKGAILDTSVGKARVTNRPGNEGIINAILIKE